MLFSRTVELFRERSGRERLIAWGIAVAALVPFAPLAVHDDRVLPYFEWSDYTALQLPVHEFVRDEVRAGHVPLWIPWIACGTPLHASQQAGVFYPGLTLPLLVFPSNAALKLALFAHLALAYAGQYLLCSALGIRATSASLGALVVVQSGFMVNHLMAGHITIVVGAALVPWLFWALLRLCESPTALRAAVAALVGSGFALGSHPQISYYTLLASTAGVASWSLCRGTRASVRAIAWLAVAAASTAMLAAVQIVPSAELALDGLTLLTRGGEDYATSFSLNGLDVVRLVAPNIAGNPFLNLPSPSPNDFFHERVTYFGISTLAVMVYGLSRANVPRWSWFAAAFALIAMAIALGAATPWFSLLGQITPGLFWFRCPGRVYAVATPLAALLAARACDAILTGEPRASRRTLWLPLLVLAFAGCVVLPSLVRYGNHLAWRAVFDHGWSAARGDVLATIVFGLLTAGAIVMARRERRDAPGVASLLLTVLMLADLGYNNAANFWLEAPESPEIPKDVLKADPPVRFVDAPYYPHVGERWLRYSRMVPTAVRNRRSMVGADDGGVLPDAVMRFWGAITSEPSRILSVGACSYVTHRGGKWTKLPDVLPRVRFATGKAATLCDVPMDDLSDDHLHTMSEDLLNDSATDRANHYVERGPPRAGVDKRARILRDEPMRLDVHVNAPTEGVLVVADTWYPGWTCEIDGVPAAVRSAHSVFRAVNVPFGQHNVVFEYRPKSFYIGAVMSIAGLILVALLATFGVLTCKKPPGGLTP